MYKSKMCNIVVYTCQVCNLPVPLLMAVDLTLFRDPTTQPV